MSEGKLQAKTAEGKLQAKTADDFCKVNNDMSIKKTYALFTRINC